MSVSGNFTLNASFLACGPSFSHSLGDAKELLRGFPLTENRENQAHSLCAPNLSVTHHPFHASEIRAACGVHIWAPRPHTHLSGPQFSSGEKRMFWNI